MTRRPRGRVACGIVNEIEEIVMGEKQLGKVQVIDVPVSRCTRTRITIKSSNKENTEGNV